MNIKYKFNGLTFRTNDHVLTRPSGENVQLEPRLGRLLEILCEHQDEVLSRDQLVQELWASRVVSDESLTVAISQLRRHLRQADTASAIKTLPGRGYVWQPATTRCSDAQSHSRPTQRRSHLLIACVLVTSTLVLTLVMMTLPKGPMPQAETATPNLSDELHHAAVLVEEKTDIDKAIRLYRTVLKEGPSAIAYLGLAKAKLARITPDELPLHAEELIGLLTRAREENSDLTEIDWLLGRIYFYGQWDFTQAKAMMIAEYDRGNRSPLFLQQLAQVMLAIGEADWVKRAIHQLRQHHPEYYAAPSLAWLHLLLGDIDSAQREITRILNIEPADVNLHISAQHVAYQAGDTKKAWFHLDALLAAAEIEENVRDKLRNDFSNGGLKAVHRALMDDPLSGKLGHYTPPIANARHAVVAGEHELAIQHIAEAIKLRQREVLWLLADPHYAPLYDHPGFIALTAAFRSLTGTN